MSTMIPMNQKQWFYGVQKIRLQGEETNVGFLNILKEAQRQVQECRPCFSCLHCCHDAARRASQSDGFLHGSSSS